MTHIQYPPPAPTAQPETGLAIASLVLGIIGVLFFWLYGIAPVLAVVFGAVSRNKSRKLGVQPSGMATAGLVLGIVELAIVALIIIALVAAA